MRFLCVQSPFKTKRFWAAFSLIELISAIGLITVGLSILFSSFISVYSTIKQDEIEENLIRIAHEWRMLLHNPSPDQLQMMNEKVFYGYRPYSVSDWTTQPTPAANQPSYMAQITLAPQALNPTSKDKQIGTLTISHQPSNLHIDDLVFYHE